MNKSIAFFLPSFKVGGGNRVLIKLYEFLSHENNSHKLFFIEREGSSFENTISNTVVFKPLFNNIFFYIIEVIIASYRIRKSSYLTYVILSDPILAIFSFIYSNKKTIRYVQSDDALLFKNNPNAGKLIKFFYFKLFLISQKYKYYKVFFNSKYSKLSYQKTSNTFLPNNFNIINPSVFTLKYPKRKLEFPTKKNTVIAIVLSKHLRKGAEIFFDIVKNTKFQQIQYLVISQDKFDFYNDNVKYCKPTNDNEYVALLKKSHFILSTSTFEGFGLPLLEGMGLGLVPIAFMNGGIKEYTRYIDIDIIKDVKSFDRTLNSFIADKNGIIKYKVLSKKSHTVASMFNEEKFYSLFTCNL